MAPEPRFLCDQMLGSLARWLRFLGYDTLYPEAMDDTSILKMARDDGRMLLTRDKELASRAQESGRLVRSDVLDDQLADVRKVFGLDLSGEKLLSRCSLCNAVLTVIDKGEAEKAGVPAVIVQRHDRFWRCPGCGQLYWPGSHYERIMDKIGELDKGSE
jgi:uncharacterized protein with PIN domain